MVQGTQIGHRERFDVGAGNGGGEPVVFADFGGDFVRRGDKQIRGVFGDQPRRFLFVGGIGIGVQEQDRHRTDIAGAQRIDRGA